MTRRRGVDTKIEPLLLDPTAVSEILSISETQVYRLIRDGHITQVTVTGTDTKRIPYSELKKWIHRLVTEKAGTDE